MKKWLRRIRAAMGIGLTWGAAWFAAGMALLVVVGPNAADVPFPLFFGLLGFLAGTTFAGILGVVAGRRRFDQMSLPGFAAWGALGGVLLSVVVGFAAGAEFLVLGSVFGVAGAISAAGTLALARSAERRALVGAETEVTERVVDTDETRELPGAGS